MQSLPRLIPLLIAVAVLLCGNGVLLTLISLKGAAVGFSITTIGLLGTVYFGGFLISSIYAPRLIDLFGHIRVFAALAALSTISALMLALTTDVYVWALSRALAGFCIAGLFTAIESWINGVVENRDRGRMLSLYSLVDLAAVTASQQLIPMVGIDGTVLFLLTAIMFSLAALPVTLSPREAPHVLEPVKLKLSSVWKVSPLAFATCFVIGLTNSSYRSIGPIFADRVGLDTAGVAAFITAGIVGGAVLQIPIGWASDRIDRRNVLAGATLLAVCAGLMLSWLSRGEFVYAPDGAVYITPTGPWLFYAGSFVFGAFALPLYSIAAAHANDFARPGQFATVTAGMLFTYGVSATVGPLLSSQVMEYFGPPGFFTFISLAHGSLLAFALTRMRVRDTVPSEDRVLYTPLLRTSRGIFKLAKRRLTETQGERDERLAHEEAAGSSRKTGKTPSP